MKLSKRSRRGLLVLGALVSGSFLLLGQGIVGGNAAAVARGKFSGKPWLAEFTDVAAQAGLTARFTLGDPVHKKYIVEANGTGVAFLDYDNDGLLDVFLVNGASFDAKVKATNHLYRNVDKTKFEDVTVKAGMARAGWGNGVCGGDIDNDGHTDLFVTYWGPDALLRNRGDGTFEEMAAKAGVAGPAERWSTGCTFLDYDRDGKLDLLVASYAGFSTKTTPLPGGKPFCLFLDAPVFCGPRGLPHGAVALYRNLGSGSFSDVSATTGISKAAGFYAFTATAADWNGDGWTDIYVACDSSPSLYFRNNGNGTFSELAAEAGIAYSEHGAEQAGMGVAVADYDNDGWLDITKTNFIRDYPNLYRNLGKGIFEDAAVASGLGVNPNYVLWGVGMEDFDNDGQRDLFQVAGHVYPGMEKVRASEAYANPRLLYRNLGNGRFEDVAHLAGAAVADRHSSHGAAFGDYDNDGAMDVLIMNKDEAPSLLRNRLASDRKWIKVVLRGTRSPRSAEGSTVTVRVGAGRQTAVAVSQSSYLSLNDNRLHFGLGANAQVDGFTVRWSSGVAEDFPGAPAGHLVRLVEGTGESKIEKLK